MKKIFTLSLILAAGLPLCAVPKTPVMGAGKDPGTLTAHDLDGQYELTYYSTTLIDGSLEGEVTEYSFNTILKATDDETVEITNFFNQNADPIYATFDADNMTLTIPNNIDLGTLVFNPGEVNESSTKATLKYYDASVYPPVEVDKDLVFTVDPEKRSISFSCKKNEEMPSLYDEVVYIMTPENSSVAEIGSITYHYTNTRYTNNVVSDINTVNTSNLYAEYDESEKTLTLYNFAAEELWVYPTVFNIKSDNSLVANKQLCMIVAEEMYFADKNGEPFTLTGKIQNADDGYEMILSDYGWQTETMTYDMTYINNLLKIREDIFGETTPRPVIEPVGEDPLACEFVTISHSDPAAEIFYTTDGSVPTENSTVYDSRIPVTSDSVIRAIAKSENLLPSHVFTFDIKALGVGSVADDALEVSVENGRIIAPEGARAFNVNGMSVNIDNTLPAGIYIVVLNGKTAKVIVK